MSKRPREADHERHATRVSARTGGTPIQLPPASTDEQFVVDESARGFVVRARSCPGFAVCRGECTPEAAAAVSLEIESEQAGRLSWTALRDGGNSDSLFDTVKAYCGEKDQMLARGGRYRQQLLVRGRRADPLLALPHIAAVRRRALALATETITECAASPSTTLAASTNPAAAAPTTAVASTAAATAAPAAAATTPVRPCAPAVTLLTEQLIKYLPSDRWFAPHWDKDRRDTSSAPLDPKAYDGPGDALTTLCLGCPCTLLMLPRRGGEARPFAIELQPGDIYVLAEEARWDWKHGISVSEAQTAARRAIVWRLLVDF